MLKALQKALGGKPEVEANEGTGLAVEAAVAEAVAGVRAEFDEFKTAAEALLSESADKINTLTAELAEAKAALEAATNAQAAAEAAALAAKLNARKEKLVASVGTERADALMKVAEGMDDAAFEAVVSALSVSAKVEAESPLFTEVGVEAEADAAKVIEESEEMRILKNKYDQK